MCTHNICFRAEIRNILIHFGEKKHLIMCSVIKSQVNINFPLISKSLS